MFPKLFSNLLQLIRYDWIRFTYSQWWERYRMLKLQLTYIAIPVFNESWLNFCNALDDFFSIETWEYISSRLSQYFAPLRASILYRVLPVLQYNFKVIIVSIYNFYVMQDQRWQAFSQFFSTRRISALSLVRSFIYGCQKPILILRSVTSEVFTTFIMLTRVSSSSKITLVTRILFIIMLLITIFGFILLFIL